MNSSKVKKLVKDLEWVKVADWSELTETFIDSANHQKCVGKEDVNIFVDNLFMKVACELNIPYKTLRPILVEENFAFYTLESCLFKSGKKGYPKYSDTMLNIERLLLIPDVLQTSNSDNHSRVDKLLADFSTLNEKEKMEFLNRLELACKFFTK